MDPSNLGFPGDVHISDINFQDLAGEDYVTPFVNAREVKSATDNRPAAHSTVLEGRGARSHRFSRILDGLPTANAAPSVTESNAAAPSDKDDGIIVENPMHSICKIPHIIMPLPGMPNVKVMRNATNASRQLKNSNLPKQPTVKPVAPSVGDLSAQALMRQLAPDKRAELLALLSAPPSQSGPPKVITPHALFAALASKLSEKNPGPTPETVMKWLKPIPGLPGQFVINGPKLKTVQSRLPRLPKSALPQQRKAQPRPLMAKGDVTVQTQDVGVTPMSIDKPGVNLIFVLENPDNRSDAALTKSVPDRRLFFHTSCAEFGWGANLDTSDDAIADAVRRYSLIGREFKTKRTDHLVPAIVPQNLLEKLLSVGPVASDKLHIYYKVHIEPIVTYVRNQQAANLFLGGFNAPDLFGIEYVVPSSLLSIIPDESVSEAKMVGFVVPSLFNETPDLDSDPRILMPEQVKGSDATFSHDGVHDTQFFEYPVAPVEPPKVKRSAVLVCAAPGGPSNGWVTIVDSEYTDDDLQMFGWIWLFNVPKNAPADHFESAYHNMPFASVSDLNASLVVSESIVKAHAFVHPYVVKFREKFVKSSDADNPQIPASDVYLAVVGRAGSVAEQEQLKNLLRSKGGVVFAGFDGNQLVSYKRARKMHLQTGIGQFRDGGHFESYKNGNIVTRFQTSSWSFDSAASACASTPKWAVSKASESVVPDEYPWLQSIETWQNNRLTYDMTRELKYTADEFDMGQNDEVDVPIEEATGSGKRMKGSEIASNVDEFMRAESEKWVTTQIESEILSPFNTPVREIPDLQVRDPERLIPPPCPLHTPIGVKHSVV